MHLNSQKISPHSLIQRQRSRLSTALLWHTWEHALQTVLCCSICDAATLTHLQWIVTVIQSWDLWPWLVLRSVTGPDHPIQAQSRNVNTSSPTADILWEHCWRWLISGSRWCLHRSLWCERRGSVSQQACLWRNPSHPAPGWPSHFNKILILEHLQYDWFRNKWSLRWLPGGRQT